MNHFLRQYRTSLFLFSLLACTQIQAQEFRLGFVKTDRIFKEARMANVAQAKLEQEFSGRDKDLVDQTNQLKSAVDKFQVEAPILSQTQRVNRQKELADRDRELQRKRRGFQEDLNVRKNERLQEVLGTAKRAIKQAAEAGKYDLVLEEAVYVNSKYDLTDKILEIMNSDNFK